jgi:L-gulono-1,4-lactone dehydrogenase
MTTRRDLLGFAAAAMFVPEAAFADDRPCYPPRYDRWTARRERRWPERIGKSGFVSYYGEAFEFDSAINTPKTTSPSCNLWGSEATTLDNKGSVKHQLVKLEREGLKSTDCHVWPTETADGLEANVASIKAQLSAACPVPAKPAPVRFVAVGSHHSSSDVFKRVDDTHTVMVRIDGLNQVVLSRPEWKPGFAAARKGGLSLAYDPAFALVGAGLHVCELNETLWDPGLAIETQGSFDGQTLAGAISTGTHGAGAEHGAIADSVEAVIVVTCLQDESGAAHWEILQVEPDADDAITDASRFVTARGAEKWRLVQDDTLFEALLVGFGTLGVIVGYIVRVRPAYFLRELRVGRPWNEVQQNLVERATVAATGFSNEGWRYELVVNPTAVEGLEAWVCTEVYRDAWTYDLDYLSTVREIPQKWAGEITRNVNLGGALGNSIAQAANDALARGKRVGYFADRCYRVLKLGQGEFVQAWGCEFMVPAERGAELVQWIAEENPKRGELKRGKRRGTRLLNPYGVRFCRGRKGFLSPTRRIREGEAELTCTAEITETVKDNDIRNLQHRENGKPSSKAIIESWAEDYLVRFGADARLHWGQVQGPFGPEHLAATYPKEDVDRWFDAFRTLNPFGLFDTSAAKRLGFVDRRDGSSHPPVRYKGL